MWLIRFVLTGLLTGIFSSLILMAAETEEQGPGRRSSGPEGQVTGRLIDEESGEPLMYASLVLHAEADSAMVTGAISNESGHFVVEDVPTGEYYLVVNFVGYPQQKINGITIDEDEPSYDMGTIEVAPDVELLGEVTVEAARELMEVGLDRRVFNVEQELTAAGGSALDIMENIPSVAVDFEGNVSLRGSTNVTILIDGRPSNLIGLSGSEALEQFPSEMVERVEVVTNPSVRYDPDGTSGIINIVMKEEHDPGYNGMVSLNASTGGRYSGSLNMNYNLGSVNLFGSYSGRLSDMDGYGHNYRTSFLADTTYMDQYRDFDNEMDSHNFTLGFDYEINDRNTLTLSAGSNSRDRESLSEIDYYAMDPHRDLDDVFHRNSFNTMDNSGYRVNMAFRRTFDEEYREWNTDISYSTRENIRSEENEQVFDPAFGSGRSNLYENTFTDGSSDMLRIQTDYEHPLGDETKLELGGQAYWRERGSDFRFYDFDHESGQWENNEGLSNHFVHTERRFSAYGILSTILGHYSVQGGLRLEQANVEADQRTTDEVYTSNYFSFFPSLHLRRNIDQAQSVQLSYSRRISRPRGRQINPFPSYSDPYHISSGNPNLDPEYTNSLELGYTRYGNGTTINPSVFYRQTNGAISRFSTMDEEGVNYTTFDNINYEQSLGAELVLNQQLFDFWRATATTSYFYRRVEGDDHQDNVLHNESYSWSARLVNDLRFPRGWSAQVTGRYSSPVVMLQGEMKARYSADIAVRKNVLNNTGTITLRLSDAFNTQRFQMYNYGDNFEVDSERRRNSRMIHIGFSYRINEYERRDRRDRDDMDDDMDFDEFM